jgi:hypothetical protein
MLGPGRQEMVQLLLGRQKGRDERLDEGRVGARVVVGRAAVSHKSPEPTQIRQKEEPARSLNHGPALSVT